MLSTFPTLLPFLLFAFVASITPGPTNILVLDNSARYGLKHTLPMIVGACASAASIVWLVGCGFGELLSRTPYLQTAMQWLGVAWLSYLAWKVFRAPPLRLETRHTAPIGGAGVWTAISLQWVNPKTWMMALSVIGVFVDNSGARADQVWHLSAVFFLVALPCLFMWAVLGAGSRRLITSNNAQQRFNQIMGLLLLFTAWMGSGVIRL